MKLIKYRLLFPEFALGKIMFYFSTHCLRVMVFDFVLKTSGLSNYISRVVILAKISM